VAERPADVAEGGVQPMTVPSLLLIPFSGRRGFGPSRRTLRRAVIHPPHEGGDFGLCQSLSLGQDHVVGAAHEGRHFLTSHHRLDLGRPRPGSAVGRPAEAEVIGLVGNLAGESGGMAERLFGCCLC
jgi:hypothetical protein